MDSWTSILSRALISGSVAGVASTAVVAAMGRAEGEGALRPINATSHWLYGDRAAVAQRGGGWPTLIGFATNHAAAVFWALLFETIRARRGNRDLAGTATSALAVAATAAVVDYGLMPRRLTPGWELAVSKGSVGAGLLALAAGLTLGGLLADRSTARTDSWAAHLR